VKSWNPVARYLLWLVLLYIAVVVAIGVAVSTDSLPWPGQKPEWVTPSPIGPPPDGWADR
jgi:hypothetical protein